MEEAMAAARVLRMGVEERERRGVVSGWRLGPNLPLPP
jgi:hypothetical protein